MGYLFLAGALLAGVSKGFCGKKVGNYASGYRDASFVNLLRMLFCTVLGLGMMFVQGSDFSLPSADMLWISVLSGVTTSAFVIFWLISVKNGSYMMLDVFLMLGVGMTVGCGFLFLKETPRWNQIVGFVLLVIAAWIMTSYNTSLKGKPTAKGILTLLACGAANGLTDFSQKLFTHRIPKGSIAEFSLYTYLFAAATLLIVWLFFAQKDRRAGIKSEPLPKVVILLVGLMSVFLFLNSYLKTKAATYLDSALLYPLNQGAALILSMVMAAVFFKEKITPKCLLGIGVAFGALLIINLL